MYIKRAKKIRKEIITKEDLRDALQEQNDHYRAHDPTHPRVKVLIDDSDKPAGPTYKLKAENFHITKTYCVESTPRAMPGPGGFGVQVMNYIYSSKPMGVDLTPTLFKETIDDEDKPYRRGYWGKNKGEWCTSPEPLPDGRDTALTRRMEKQQNALPGFASMRLNAPLGEDDLQAVVQKRLAATARRKARRHIARQTKLKTVEASVANATSDSSSSSSSSSESD